MNLKKLGRSALAAALLTAPMALAADHQDGPAATADPSADITDVFVWTTADYTKVNLVMDVSPAASTASKFSDTVQYVFHTSSRASFGAAAAATEDVICTFDAAQNISCWAGNEYVTGNAGGTGGLSSTSGKLKVFAGLRADPFFFNLDGFKHTVATVTAAKPSLTFDPNGCPLLDAATSAVLVEQLMTDPTGGPAVDHFLGFNALAIVVQLDKSIVTAGGPLVSMWAGTHRKP